MELTARRRVLLCLLVGMIAGSIAGFFAPWQFAALFGWTVAAGIFLISVWAQVSGFDCNDTRVHAREEDASRRSARLILIAASVVSLTGVAMALLKANHSHGWAKAVLTLVAVATVALSWAAVHTVFALRYARLFYEAPEGGIDFKNELDPDYLDFAYVAFTVGMTFQVSDTDIQKRTIRRAILGHAMLGYLFGTVIVAVTINVLAGFISK